MRPISFLLITFILVCGYQKPALAQYSVYDFNPVVVTGSLNETQLSSSLRNIIVIDQNSIRSSGAESVDQLLQDVAGVDVRSQGPVGVQSDISIRGTGAEQTLILIDGVKVTDPQTAHHNLDLPLSPEDIEQIEIIKGSASKLYGPGAYGGVINIITRKAEKPETAIHLESGSFGYYNGSAALSAKKGNFRTHLSANIQHSEGYRPNTDFDNLNLFLNNSYENSKDCYRLSAGYRKKDFGANNFYFVNNANQREDTETIFLNLNGTSNSNNGSFSTGINWRRHYDHYIYDFNSPAIYENRHFTNTLQADILKTIRFRNKVLNISLDGSGEWIESNNLGNHQRYNVGLAYEYQWLPDDRLALQLGSSAYFYSGWGGTIMPGFDLRYRITPKILWHSSIGRAFRIPTFTELYYTSPSNNGNPDLKPEKGWTMEHNLSWQKPDLTAQLGLFVRQGDEQIDWIRQTDTDPWQALNISRILSYGFETSIGFSMKGFYINTLSLSYCYIHTEKFNFEHESKYLLSSLRNQMILSLTPLDFLGIKQQWKVRFEDRLNYQNHTIIDTHLSRRFNHLTLSLTITNLLGSDYVDYSGIPMPGRWITVGLKYNLF
ncbi:TonB-dependent receptor [bacterium]|nr:TonB-dependent receptor [bacterium]